MILDDFQLKRRPKNLEGPARPGSVVQSRDGSSYIVAAHGGTLVRQHPKVKGKAARKADKRRRREQRIAEDLRQLEETDPGYDAFCQEQNEL